MYIFWFCVFILCVCINTASVVMINTNKDIPYRDKINHAGFMIILVTSVVPGVNLAVSIILFIIAAILQVTTFINADNHKKPFCEKD